MFNRDQLKANVAEVRSRIKRAAEASGRSASDVDLIAVTKYVDSEVALALADLGCKHLGESRPQQLWSKAATCKDAGIRWHMIGHVQRNKIHRSLPLVDLFHSGDSLRLLRSLDEEAAKQQRRPRVLIQVNVSGDLTKHGFHVDETATLEDEILGFQHLEICGMMAMAARDSDESEARRNFEQLRILRDDLQVRFGTKLRLNELSMGMSNDFVIAIEEGATMVRVGSALFRDTGCR